jgi:hypothetical protein
MRRERHGAGDRHQQEQHEELLEQEQLHARIRPEIGAASRHDAHPDQVGVGSEPLTRGRRHEDRDHEGQRQSDDGHDGHRQQRRTIARDVDQLLSEQRPQLRRHRDTSCR